MNETLITQVDTLLDMCNKKKQDRTEKTYQSAIFDIYEIKNRCDMNDIEFQLEAVLLSLAGD